MRRSKIVNILKKYWVIPVSLLLVFPVTVVFGMLCYLLGMMIGEVFGIMTVVDRFIMFFAHGVVGIVSALPIMIKAWRSDAIKKGMKVVIIVVSVLLLSVISYALLWAY